MRTKDDAVARWFTFENGRVRSRRGLHAAPDVTVTIASAELALKLFSLHPDQLERVEAMKNFQMQAEGPDALVVWFTQTLSMMPTLGWKFGTEVGGGVTRYVTNTNGGPMFVYVKDGQIVRITPIEFDDERRADLDRSRRAADASRRRGRRRWHRTRCARSRRSIRPTVCCTR